MDFSFSDEQRQLRDSVRAYLAQNYPPPTSRQNFEAPAHAQMWLTMARELGVAALAIPHDRGGLGGDPVDTMIVMDEFGAALVSEPFIETVVLAGHVLAGSARDAAQIDLERIADGRDRYALAHFERGGSDLINSVAHRDAGGWRLNGAKPTVLAAPWANRLIVTMIDGDSSQHVTSPLMFVVDASAHGVSMKRYATIDGRCAADLMFDNVQVDAAALLYGADQGMTFLEAALDAARAAQCAEALGIMRRMLQDTIDYTRQRRQFGKALSDFQVSRHRMTDMAMQIETATSAVYLGTLKLAAGGDERARAISTMEVMVARALRYVGQSAIQLHGGMGMTDELALGHYAKRALAIEQSYGNAEWHLRRFASLRDAA